MFKVADAQKSQKGQGGHKKQEKPVKANWRRFFGIKRTHGKAQPQQGFGGKSLLDSEVSSRMQERNVHTDTSSDEAPVQLEWDSEDCIPTMKRGAARKILGEIQRNLDNIHGKQTVDSIGKQKSQLGDGQIENPCVMIVGPIEVRIRKSEGFGGKEDLCQEISVTNFRTNRTASFSRDLPEGKERIRQAVSKTWRKAVEVLAFAGVGAGFTAVVTGIEYATKFLEYLGTGGSAAQAIEGIARAVPMSSAIEPVLLGGIGGAILAVTVVATDTILNARYGFRRMMMKFIRDASNRDEVEALENIRI